MLSGSEALMANATSPQHPGLLQAILDEPEDDAPRLIYADWLEDNGEADRAEFIRLQIELARDSSDEGRRREIGAGPVRQSCRN